MKKNLSFFLVFILAFPAGLFAAEQSSYDGYKGNVDNFCNTQQSDLWSGWLQGSPLALTFYYGDVSAPDPFSNYKSVLALLKSDPSQIQDVSDNSLGQKYVENASLVYREVMNSTYACAVLGAKFRAINSVVTTVKSKGSNIQNTLDSQQKAITKQMEDRACRKIDVNENAPSLSIKKELLDATTYQYCNYRMYLYYLQNALAERQDAYMRTAGKKNVSTNTEQITTVMSREKNKISDAILHAREVFPQAMIAYTEFERTYGSHILLTFILNDYIELRNTLKQLLNPLGQVIYKASNFQTGQK